MPSLNISGQDRNSVFKQIRKMAQILIPIVILLSVITAVLSRPSSANRELKLLHIVMRHGVRTPVSTYPRDPYVGEEFEPNGWGQLTNEGIEELFDFGGYLKARYGGFLGDRFDAREYYSEATGVDRAVSSMMAVNAGLWKPKRPQKWSKTLDWIPVPVFSTPLDDDMLLLVRKDCPQYNIELEKVLKSSEVLERYKHFKLLFSYIEEYTGQDMKTFFDVEDVYTTLLAEKAYGLKLPRWTEGHFISDMEEAAAYSFILKAYNDKLRRLKGGVLLKKLVSDWNAKVNDTLMPAERKTFLYGGHDATISNLLSALDIFDPQVPNYGMAVMFELYFNAETNRYGLEIHVKNSTSEVHQMTIPGCEKFCHLEDVVRLTSKTVPIDWAAECATDDPNYTPTKPTGP